MLLCDAYIDYAELRAALWHNSARRYIQRDVFAHYYCRGCRAIVQHVIRQTAQRQCCLAACCSDAAIMLSMPLIMPLLSLRRYFIAMRVIATRVVMIAMPLLVITAHAASIVTRDISMLIAAMLFVAVAAAHAITPSLMLMPCFSPCRFTAAACHALILPHTLHIIRLRADAWLLYCCRLTLCCLRHSICYFSIFYSYVTPERRHCCFPCCRALMLIFSLYDAILPRELRYARTLIIYVDAIYAPAAPRCCHSTRLRFFALPSATLLIWRAQRFHCC